MCFVCSLSHSASGNIKIYSKERFFIEFWEVHFLVHINIELRKDFDPIYDFPEFEKQLICLYDVFTISDISNSNKKILL